MSLAPLAISVEQGHISKRLTLVDQILPGKTILKAWYGKRSDIRPGFAKSGQVPDTGHGVLYSPLPDVDFRHSLIKSDVGTLHRAIWNKSIHLIRKYVQKRGKPWVELVKRLKNVRFILMANIWTFLVIEMCLVQADLDGCLLVGCVVDPSSKLVCLGVGVAVVVVVVLVVGHPWWGSCLLLGCKVGLTWDSWGRGIDLEQSTEL